ncbi:MAG: glycosyltransferase [Verrucomicrobiae bacterium]|nr:glycosyltransferase [Verrucomicrobiae bacterium]
MRVITRANNRCTIEASREPWVRDVQWLYWDPPRWLTFWKRGGRGTQLFYIIWQWGVKSKARRSMEERDADVIHHLTFGKYWVPSRLARLGRPFLFGPVGGGEHSPPGLTACTSLRGSLTETSKALATWFVGHFPPSVRLLRSADWTFAATKQTEHALRRLGVPRVCVLPQSGIRPTDIPSALLSEPQPDRDERVFTLVSASRLIHWKAVDLAIEALSQAVKHIPARLIVLQTGPEMENLKRLAKDIGVDRHVEFKGRLAGLEDVYRQIRSADALIHPALHEAFGQACLEALALGTPVICLNWAGPGLIIDQATGIAVQPGNRKETISRLAEAIVTMSGRIRNPEACQARAYGVFHWEQMAGSLVQEYRKIAANKEPSRPQA